MNYRKITSDIACQLSLPETYTYFCLAAKSDFTTLESFVNEDTLAEFVGVGIRTIQRHIQKMKKTMLVDVESKRNMSNGHVFYKNKYKLRDSHYVLIDNKLIDENLTREMKGFLILLKTQCLNNSNICRYSTQQLADRLTISKPTVNRYLNEAENLGYLKWNKAKQKITLLHEDIFIITRESDLAFDHLVYPEIVSEDNYDEKGRRKMNYSL